MTPDQIKVWAASGESETLEFKRTMGERREAARTLCAIHSGPLACGETLTDIHNCLQNVTRPCLEAVA